MNHTDLPSWQPDMPIDQNIADAMQSLSDEVEKGNAECDAMVPYFLIPQAY